MTFGLSENLRKKVIETAEKMQEKGISEMEIPDSSGLMLVERNKKAQGRIELFVEEIGGKIYSVCEG